MAKMLIIGKGSTYYRLNHICRVSTLKELSAYGIDSQLYQAVSYILKKGLENVAVCNVHTIADYYDIIPQIRDDIFDMIVPISLDNSCYVMENQKPRLLSVSFIETLDSPYTKLFLTDLHADDFKDVESFVKHYNKITSKIVASCKPQTLGNLVMVANQLEDSPYASLDVALSILATTPGHYPSLRCGPIKYMLDANDFIFPIIYFKENTITEASLENPFGLGSLGLENNIVIQHMMNQVRQELDLNSFKGKKFHTVTVNEIKLYLDKVLKPKEGFYFEKYEVEDIILRKETVGISIETIINILPFFCYDTVQVSIKE